MKKYRVKWTPHAGTWITPELVKAARALVKWTQRELARQAAVPPMALAHFERGAADMTLAERMQIVAALAREQIRFCRGSDRTAEPMIGVQRLSSARLDRR